jgi:hypothetical protein
MVTIVLGLLMLSVAPAGALPINQIAPGSLTGTGLITFDDVAGGTAPGTNYDAVFESNGADFAERFVGQTNTPSGGFDVLSGSPTGTLSLAVGVAGQNLNVFSYNPSNVLTGLGPVGFPNFDAIGEGSFAVLFDFDQSEFGFDLVGGNNGNAYASFFRRDGSLIDQIILAGLSDQSYAFSREGGINDIAGISIYNDDGGGIGFDNLRHDVPGGPGPGTQVPEPSTLLLLGLGLGGLGLWRRMRKDRVAR